VSLSQAAIAIARHLAGQGQVGQVGQVVAVVAVVAAIKARQVAVVVLASARLPSGLKRDQRAICLRVRPCVRCLRFLQPNQRLNASIARASEATYKASKKRVSQGALAGLFLRARKLRWMRRLTLHSRFAIATRIDSTINWR
jgi:hypothetical protein